LTGGIFDNTYEISSVTPLCEEQKPVDKTSDGQETYAFARVNFIDKFPLFPTAVSDWTVEYYGCDGSRTLMWTLVNNRPNWMSNSEFSVIEPSSSLPVGTIKDISSLWTTGFDGLISKNEDMALAALITVLMAKVAFAPLIILLLILMWLGDTYRND